MKLIRIPLAVTLILAASLVSSRGVPPRAPGRHAKAGQDGEAADVKVEDIKAEEIPHSQDMPKKNSEVVDLHYNKYLQKIMEALEKNPQIREEILKYDLEQIKNGEMELDISYLSNELREELDDWKRKEVERIRHLLRAQKDLEQGRIINHKEIMREAAGHIDVASPHVFTADDLKNLVSSAAKDLQDFDNERHEKFKKYELHKKAMEEERLSNMTDSERDAEIARLREEKNKHKQHDPMNHPGSKKQFEEVWNEEDEMVDEDFDPRTFFALHDTNSDGMWDIYEVEALMAHELSKVYDPNNHPEDDMIEMDEERANMREHLFGEVDTNGDQMISREEFMKYSATKEFEKPVMDSYETVDQQIERGHVYSKEELAEYKEVIKVQEEELKQRIAEFKQESKYLVEDKKETAIEKSEYLRAIKDVKFESEEEKEDHKEYLKSLSEREQELNNRQKILEEMSREIKEMAQDVVDMKKDYAENVMNSDEMKDTMERLEMEKQKKIEEAKAKLEKTMQEKIDERMNSDAGKEKLAKMEELLKKQEEWNKKIEDFQHNNL